MKMPERIPNHTAPMLLSLAALLSPILLAGCSSEEAGAGMRPAVPVTAAQVTRQPMPVQVEAIGTVEAIQSVEVTPQVGGRLTAVYFEEGQMVERGQRLAAIDPRTYRAAVAEAEARLAQDEARLEKARGDVERYRALVAKEYITQERFAQYQAEAQALAAAVEADQAALVQARLDLQHATVEAPIDGRTGELYVDVGNVIGANEDALVSIQQLQPIRVRFAVPQEVLPDLQRRQAATDESAGGMKVEAWPAGGTGEPVVGELSFIDNRIDPGTGTIQLRAAFDNQAERLWPGQFVDVTLTLKVQEDAVVVPAVAVDRSQQGDFVFVVGEDKMVESQPVQVARIVGQQAVIAQGLEGGETVVTDGQLRLRPGASVTIKTESASPPSGETAAAEAPAPTDNQGTS